MPTIEKKQESQLTSKQGNFLITFLAEKVRRKINWLAKNHPINSAGLNTAEDRSTDILHSRLVRIKLLIYNKTM